MPVRPRSTSRCSSARSPPARPEAAARTIFPQNISASAPASARPNLCEQACVREKAEGAPVQIGRLQRYATDTLQGKGIHPFTRAPKPASASPWSRRPLQNLACAHRLAMHGHRVQIFDYKPRGGRLNEYGIAAYRGAGRLPRPSSTGSSRSAASLPNTTASSAST
ncbi:MAG: hypothetical protein R3D80_12745 [Paracoccaceae bacterium]